MADMGDGNVFAAAERAIVDADAGITETDDGGVGECRCCDGDAENQRRNGDELSGCCSLRPLAASPRCGDHGSFLLVRLGWRSFIAARTKEKREKLLLSCTKSKNYF